MKMGCASARGQANNSSRVRAANDQRAVLAAKCDAIAQSDIDIRAACAARKIVQIALRVGLIEIDRRMQPPLTHSQNCRSEPSRTAGALWMADHGFGRAHRNIRRAPAEAALQRKRLHLVVELRAGPV